MYAGDEIYGDDETSGPIDPDPHGTRYGLPPVDEIDELESRVAVDPLTTSKKSSRRSPRARSRKDGTKMATAPIGTTTATIDGAKTPLLFGARYRVRFGTKDARLLVDAELVDRAKNGDLLFREAGERVRVRPSVIVSLAGSGTEATTSLDGEPAVDYRTESELLSDLGDVAAGRIPRHALVAISGDSLVSPRLDGETWSAYLRRLEAPIPKGLGASYSRWIETGPGQDALRAAADEAKAARKVSEKPLAERPATPAPKPSAKPKLTRAGRAKLVSAGVEPELAAKAETAEDAGVPIVAEPGSLAARILDHGRAKGTPYAERNQVWRCGECKRRLRGETCSGPKDGPAHPPVAAPAGKRKASRA